MQAREYQVTATNSVIKYIVKGFNRVLCQMPTGAGKTFMFCYFIKRYLKANPDHQIRIIVHRDKLLKQTQATLQKMGITNASVHMIEGFCNQLKKGFYLSTNLIIPDECHRGEMRKLFSYFPTATIIGFSATPLSATKKNPLKAQYEQIVIGPDVRELIAIHEQDPTQGLVPAIHYQPVNAIDKKNIGKSAGDYNMRQMSDELSKTKIVDGVLANYVKIGENKKTIVFNSLREHSLKVNDCFVSHGYNSRHLDGTMSAAEEKDIWRWFADTPDAILQTVDKATTGVDEPTIINVIPNRLTLSLPLWLQMTGRGSRPYPGKDYFNIIDTVGNIAQHGRWDHKHDWYSLFHYPDKPGSGAPPMKICPNKLCEAQIYMSATKCEYCGHLMPRETVYTDLVIELKLVPDTLIVPRNSPITMEKTITEIAEKVKTKPIDLYEKRTVMEFAIKKLHDQSGIRINSNMAVHLASKHL